MASQVVLAAKAKQEDVPWYKYTWRLCVSYRMLNQVTRAFAYTIKRCDDAVEEIPPEAQFFITADMDAGYWQIETEEASRDRLAFFVPNGKLQWTVMPMDALNAPAVFVAMMAILQAEWLAAGLKQCGSQVIVDNILLWAATVRVLLEFFLIVLYVLQKYRPTLKLKKSQFITPRCEFVGIDLVPGDRSPAQT
jgi:hypothetical protein